MNSISSPELLTPPKPTVATDVARQIFAAKKVQVPLRGVKSTFNYAPAVKHLKGQSVNILGINRAN